MDGKFYMADKDGVICRDAVKGCGSFSQEEKFFVETLYNSFLLADDCVQGACPWKNIYGGVLGVETPCPLPEMLNRKCDGDLSSLKLESFKSLENCWSKVVSGTLTELARRHGF